MHVSIFPEGMSGNDIPYRGNVLLIVFHYACEAVCPRGAADQMFWLLSRWTSLMAGGPSMVRYSG